MKHQRFRYAQVLPIVVADNPILSVALQMLPRFTGDSTMQGGEGKGASKIGNFFNKNKNNISQMIIPLPPVSLNFSTASESLNLPPSADPNRLQHQHRNAISLSPQPQPKPPLPKSDTISAAVLWPLWLKNPGSFLAKKISLYNREHLGIPSMR